MRRWIASSPVFRGVEAAGIGVVGHLGRWISRRAEWRIAICIDRGLERRLVTTFGSRRKGLGIDIWVGSSRRHAERSLLSLWSPFDLWNSGSHSAWTNATRGLKTQRRASKRRRVDGRHPNPGLVDFEQVGDQGIKVNVSVSEIVERQLLPIPTVMLVQ